MNPSFETLQVGTDGATYRLNVTYYELCAGYSYAISDPRQDGKMRTLL